MPVNAPVGEFNLGRLERVIYGPGKIALLGAELERRGLTRALVVTTLGGFPILDQVTAALGPRCAGVFTGVVQHVPRSTVDALQAEMERTNADCLVSFGGGSPIDSSKVAIYGTLPKREVVHIAVPTTLSAAEYTHAGGVTDETTRVKGGVYDPRVLPRTVITDPLLSLETPDWLWVTTGMRALDHAIECAYAIRHQPLSDALAAKAISLLVEHLPASIAADHDERVRAPRALLHGSWFSIYGAMNTRSDFRTCWATRSARAGMCRTAWTSCITLPHAMRFMAELAADRFGPIADGYGIAFDPDNPKPAALKCADWTEQFTPSSTCRRHLKTQASHAMKSGRS